jgi:hypothetical protein
MIGPTYEDSVFLTDVAELVAEFDEFEGGTDRGERAAVPRHV